MRRCQGTKRTINHLLQVFGISYEPRDVKGFGSRLHGLREHSPGPPLAGRQMGWKALPQGNTAWILDGLLANLLTSTSLSFGFVACKINES